MAGRCCLTLALSFANLGLKYSLIANELIIKRTKRVPKIILIDPIIYFKFGPTNDFAVSNNIMVASLVWEVVAKKKQLQSAYIAERAEILRRSSDLD